MAARGPDYAWDRQAGRYRNLTTGRYASEATVREWLDQALRHREAMIRELARQLQAREISRAAWRLAMREQIKGIHLYSAALAKGGWRRLTQSDFGRVGAIVRQQYRFLARLDQQIRRGLPLDGYFLQRVGLYAQAARGETFEPFREREERKRGQDEAWNDLQPAEHCEGPGSCVEQTALGWMSLDDPRRIPIGQRLCRHRCRCRWRYRASGARRSAV